MQILDILHHITKRSLLLALRLSVLVLLASALVSGAEPSALERVLQSGTLRVISRNGPTTYYEGPNGYTGFEYAIAREFADSLGVKLEVVETEDLAHILDAVGSDDGEFAAAGLTVTEKRKQKVRFTSPYFDVTQLLVYQSGQARPESPKDLVGKKIVIIANSSHAERLRELRRSLPELDWEEVFDLEPVELLELVQKGKIDYTIVDSNAFELSSSRYPKVRVAFKISAPQHLAWAFPRGVDNSLFDKANEFFARIKASGELATLRETFYGHTREMDYGDSLLFAKRLNSRLPRWKKIIKAAAENADIDWQLLAAVSYQESHWNPRAVSPTGVKGFMMLTQTTAEEMGIDNRLDGSESITGGALYYRKTYDRIPQRIAEPDRTWLALAAYNIGFGHLEDARKLTQARGGDPDKWNDVKDNLLLLAKRKYYKHTDHGYARGWEAVSYVQNIRNYYSIIAWHEQQLEKQELALSEEKNSSYETVSNTVTDAVKVISGPSDGI